MEQQANPTIFQTALSISSPTDTLPCGGPLGSFSYTPATVSAQIACLPPPSSQLAVGSIGRIIDPNYRNPVTEEFNVGYSWALNSNSVFEVEYTHVLGLHENKTVNIDQKVPAGTDASGNVILTRPLTPAFTAAGQPTLNSVRDDASVNRNRYDGVNFSFRQRMSRHFSLNASYALARAMGYDYGGGPGAAAFRNYARDSYALFAPYEFGPASNDERHHITIAGLVNLPKGFEFAPILQYGSARPYNLFNGTADNTLNTGGGTTTAVVVPKSEPTNWFAFAGNDVGAQNCFYLTNNCTISKFDPLRGDAVFELDAKLAKNIRLGERVNLQIIAQAFNLTNRANYGNNFGNNISSASTFGHPIGFFAPTATFIPRSLWSEWGVHLTF
jgi:hypothetical protein